MLVLTRQRGQSIKINDDITITVTSIGHNSVAIGIDAPKEVTIHREEVYDEIKRNISPGPFKSSVPTLLDPPPKHKTPKP